MGSVGAINVLKFKPEFAIDRVETEKSEHREFILTVHMHDENGAVKFDSDRSIVD